jgi:hypothetical protein
MGGGAGFDAQPASNPSNIPAHKIRDMSILLFAVECI